MNTVIVIDSCCDLPLEYIEAHKETIKIIGMPVNIDGEEWVDDLGKTLKHEYLYSKLAEGVMPTTAQINMYQFQQTFETLTQDNKSIVYIGLSKGLSGTNNNALVAARDVKESYPNAHIEVLESVSASIGQGILIMKAVSMAEEGQGASEIHTWLKTNELSANHWFAVTDLNHLKNGGRITPAQAAVGTLLNVKPILVVDFEGRLKAFTKVKGRKKSIKYLAEQFKAQFDDTEYDKVIIGHGHVYDDAMILKEQLLKYVSEDQILVSELSATIASHVGPGMLALGFMGKTRAN
jgi:DegV family protein with EDD domain